MKHVCWLVCGNAAGLKPDDAVEDVTVAWADALVRLAAWELRTAAASCYAAAAARSASGAGSAGGGASSLSSRCVRACWAMYGLQRWVLRPRKL